MDDALKIKKKIWIEYHIFHLLKNRHFENVN
jgi:hypothetical protein